MFFFFFQVRSVYSAAGSTHRVCDQWPVCAGGCRPAPLCIDHCEAAETGWTATPRQADTTSGHMKGHLLADRRYDNVIITQNRCLIESKSKLLITNSSEILQYHGLLKHLINVIILQVD